MATKSANTKHINGMDAVDNPVDALHKTVVGGLVEGGCFVSVLKLYCICILAKIEEVEMTSSVNMIMPETAIAIELITSTVAKHAPSGKDFRCIIKLFFEK